jgi:hypothetical protein
MKLKLETVEKNIRINPIREKIMKEHDLKSISLKVKETDLAHTSGGSEDHQLSWGRSMWVL